MIQIQLLLSNTLHRQLFIVNLLKRYEVGRRASVSTIIVCRRRENVRETCRTGAEKTFAFLKIPLDKNREMVYNICVRMGVRGYSLMVKLQLPKLATRVRFPLPAPIEKGHLRMAFFYWNELQVREVASNRTDSFSYIHCRCGLLPNLLGGVQIPVTRSRRRPHDVFLFLI